MKKDESKNYDYLPKFIRSEKGQKLLFNLIADFYKDNNEDHNIFNKYSKEVLYEYIFDVFFKSAFDYGFTLQKTRIKGVSFYDLKDNINIQKQIENPYMSDEDFEILKNREAAVKSKNLHLFRESLKFLPDLFPEFYKGRDYFKLIHGFNNEETYNSNPLLKIINYRDGQILIMDWVLWFLAMFGYKLQRSKKRYTLLNYYDDLITDDKNKRMRTQSLLK